MSYTLGIDLGGTAIKLAAIDISTREILHQRQVPTLDGESSSASPAFLTQSQSAIVSIADELDSPATAIGISAPGLAAKDARSIAHMPGRLSGLENLNWGELLQRPNKVPVTNDAHAALIGEIAHGAARNLSDVILLTLGTGVGGAIVSGGRLLRGHIGRAGHLGHLTTDFRAPGDICGTPGSLEDAIGFCTLKERSAGKFNSTTELVAAVESGDAAAVKIWDDSVRALAASIASLTNILDPEAVIIGGGIAKAGAPLFDRISQYLEKFEWRPAGHRVKIIPAQLGEWAGAYGAAHLAINPKQ